jgi:threonine/homoserine/homoserine lactone efflux protein
MKSLQNIVVGFVVSFLGSIPLGYLNVVGYQVYAKSGMRELLLFLLGVILVEAIVIYLTVIFTQQILRKQKLIKIIELFSIFFMFVLAYIFYAGGNNEMAPVKGFRQYSSTFVLGLVLSCFNFLSIPFWTGWNLYLLNEKRIHIGKKAYVLGTMLGTFVGMLTLILSLNYLSNTAFFSKYLMTVIIPLGFAALGIYQAYKFYKKYTLSKVVECLDLRLFALRNRQCTFVRQHHVTAVFIDKICEVIHVDDVRMVDAFKTARTQQILKVLQGFRKKQLLAIGKVNAGIIAFGRTSQDTLQFKNSNAIRSLQSHFLTRWR